MIEATPTAAATAGAAPLAEQERIAALLQDHSVEVPGRLTANLERSIEQLPRGTDVYISALSTSTYHDLVAVASRLQRAGCNPVPHVAARLLLNFTQFNDFLARASGEAGVRQALVIAGDVAKPRGAFEASLQLLETGLFQKHGITRVGVGGHPEGSPKIAGSALDAALLAKSAFARQSGLDIYIVTQFCFEAAPILSWTARMRALGVDLPVRVGLAGPASVKTLLKYALYCGVGTSIRALGSYSTTIARLLAETGPEAIIRAVARSVADGNPGAIAGIHFFPFGGIERTARWAQSIAEGRFTLNPDGAGFHVPK